MFVFIYKQYPENVAFCKISSYFPVEFVNLLKIRLVFIVFYCFGMFLNKPFIYLTCVHISKHVVKGVLIGNL